MLIEQKIEFELRGAVIFMAKQRLLRKSWNELLLTGKILQEAMYFTSPIWAL